MSPRGDRPEGGDVTDVQMVQCLILLENHNSKSRENREADCSVERRKSNKDE